MPNTDTRNIAVIILKFKPCGFTKPRFHHKNVDQMANSVHDAGVSDQGLRCFPRHVCPKTLDHFGIAFMKDILEFLLVFSGQTFAFIFDFGLHAYRLSCLPDMVITTDKKYKISY